MHSIQINHFDRTGPFYPLVMNYVIQLIGFKELLIRHFAGPLDIEKTLKNIQNKLNSSLAERDRDVALNTLKEISKSLSKIAGSLQLKSEFQGNSITIDIEEIANELWNNHGYLSRFLMRSASALLILAHETSKDEKYHNQHPLWEFLRHCRNAAAHGGAFYFSKGEPRRPATWGSFHIESKLQGTALFKDGNKAGFLSPGDPIRLLWDIEALLILTVQPTKNK